MLDDWSLNKTLPILNIILPVDVAKKLLQYRLQYFDNHYGVVLFACSMKMRIIIITKTFHQLDISYYLPYWCF